ncbi:MAG: ZIP family metal transporter [Chloroflexota bacterium]|nr:MAG: ZIP family metal transporter [Chloroflexota bacterium]
MAESVAARRPRPTAPSPLRMAGLFMLPLVLLAAVIALFVTTNAGLDLEAPAPINKLDIERSVIGPEGFHLNVRNVGPRELTIAQVIVNDAVWPALVDPGPTLGRLDRATINIQYAWVKAEPYEIKIITSDAIPIVHEIPAAFETPTPTWELLLSFTAIGVYVGVIPVALGLLWYPALRSVGRRAFTFLMALTVGLLIFLGIDATSEAIELTGKIASPFQGMALVGLGIVLTALLLEAISRRRDATSRSETSQRLAIASTIAVGIGAHNLGEGLAIGAAYALGEMALGSFLVVGFVIQNITEGLGVVAPIARDRPSWRRLAVLGLIAGAPAIVGTWIGGFTYSLPLGALFLAIGAGAVFQVAWEIGRLIRKDAVRDPAPFVAFSGVAAGMLVMYVTGLLMK